MVEYSDIPCGFPFMLVDLLVSFRLQLWCVACSCLDGYVSNKSDHLETHLTSGEYDDDRRSVLFILLPPDLQPDWVQRYSHRRLVWYHFHCSSEGYPETRMPVS